jgi:hypothetical protein
MNISDGIVVNLRWVSGYFDKRGNALWFRYDEIPDHGIVIEFFAHDDEISAFIMIPNGRIVRTSTKRGWHTPNYLCVRSLTALGLTPHYDMDEFVEACFRAGYTKVHIGDRGYSSSSFGATCTYDEGKEPLVSSWPAIWKLADKFGLYAGCGGHHTAQL